ncbi:MAG: hypothetical protein HYW15_03425 [Candidatus Giovannonibacteria bacterium]|nr:MAG: hypothetical protein HYW15_03425 [Candidatus Giovannonibacteria bacterium]
MANNKKFKQFPITSICREDLEGIGFDVSEVDDGTMEQIASKMADAYLEIIFWIDAPIIAEHCGVPRKKPKTA